MSRPEVEIDISIRLVVDGKSETIVNEIYSVSGRNVDDVLCDAEQALEEAQNTVYARAQKEMGCGINQ